MNLWKILALVLIGMLVVAVALRFTYIEGHEFSLNETQKFFASNAALNGLRDEIGSSNYNVTVQDHGRIIHTSNGYKNVVRVVLIQENITLTALVDMDTGNVVEKSRLEHSGWMTEFINDKNQHSKGWGYQRLFDR